MAQGLTTADADGRDSVPPASSRRTWTVVSVLGEILMTIGVLLLLVVVYDLWWTNVIAEQESASQREELQNTWREDTNAASTPPIPAEAFGLMYIPRLKSDVWGTPLIEGVEKGDLTKGFGHFPESAMPGETGNAAFAGHRATHGEPLKNIDQLQVGDLVYLETGVGWYSYRLTEDKIVQPTDVWVVDPVPGQPPGTQPTQQLLTLITCNPRWGSTQRWVWWGELVDVRSRAQGPPEEVAQLTEGS